MRPKIGDRVLVGLSEDVLNEEETDFPIYHGKIGCVEDISGNSRFPFLVSFSDLKQEYFAESELFPITRADCDWEL